MFNFKLKKKNKNKTLRKIYEIAYFCLLKFGRQI